MLHRQILDGCSRYPVLHITPVACTSCNNVVVDDVSVIDVDGVLIQHACRAQAGPPMLAVFTRRLMQPSSCLAYINPPFGMTSHLKDECNACFGSGVDNGHFAVQGTILPGITRRSILELAASKGYTVEEAPVTLEEALKADEVFTSGTAVVVSPVGSLTHQGRKVQYGEPGVGGEHDLVSHAWLLCLNSQICCIDG